MTKNYAALPYEYLEEMEALSDEEFGQLCRGLLRYSMEGIPIQPEGNLRFYTRRVMNREDRFREGFADLQRRRSEAGKKAANARWGRAETLDNSALSPDSDSMPSDSKGMPTDAENAKTETKAETKTETEAKTETETKTETKTKTEAEAEAGLLPADAGEKGGSTASAPRRADRPTREQVFDFLRERGLRVDGERFWNYYQARDWLTRNGKPVDWRKRAESWAGTETGLWARTAPPGRTAAQQRAENVSSIDEMRRALERMRAEA
ncbi:MAG: hypothetical protein LUH41_06070 [Clostridiales bacterium]|nr:hypothetical protein [Clostridiales bacterium]